MPRPAVRRSLRPVDGLLVSPLATWFPDAASLARFRRRVLGRRLTLQAPRDRAWRTLTPGFGVVPALARSGVPFHVVGDRRVDREPRPAQLGRALAAGATVYFPQVHQVLPRVMRLMVALRAFLLGPGRAECSFLFAVEGRGRPGMGLHHDGAVDAVWVQLEGRRTVTLGPPVPPGMPEELDDRLADTGTGTGWITLDLEPGTLLYLPPRTPHRVVCYTRSLALSLTWRGRPRRPGLEQPGVPGRRRAQVLARGPTLATLRRRAAALTVWDVVSGRVDAVPPRSRRWLWTQVPAVAGPVDPRRGAFPLWIPGGEVWLPVASRPLARRLLAMPTIAHARCPEGVRRALGLLRAAGVLDARDLPVRILPEDPDALDGWNFA